MEGKDEPIGSVLLTWQKLIMTKVGIFFLKKKIDYDKRSRNLDDQI